MWCVSAHDVRNCWRGCLFFHAHTHARTHTRTIFGALSAASRLQSWGMTALANVTVDESALAPAIFHAGHRTDDAKSVTLTANVDTIDGDTPTVTAYLSWDEYGLRGWGGGNRKRGWRCMARRSWQLGELMVTSSSSCCARSEARPTRRWTWT